MERDGLKDICTPGRQMRCLIQEKKKAQANKGTRPARPAGVSARTEAEPVHADAQDDVAEDAGDGEGEHPHPLRLLLRLVVFFGGVMVGG